MAFPSNPTNGQQANVNGVVYTYSSTLTAWQVTTAFNGNVTVDQLSANAVVSAGNVGASYFTGTTISVTGNITGGYILGNGSQISGLPASYSNTNVATFLAAYGSNTISTTGNITVGSIFPTSNAAQDLGSTTSRWRNIYTSDLDLNNGIGDWTIVEGEDDLFLYNNKRGKTYKFALIEVNPGVAPPKINDLKK